MDERIGCRNPDNRYNPKKTVGGYPVTLPLQNTIGLDDQNIYYAVLDTVPAVGADRVIDDLKKIVAGQKSAATTKSGLSTKESES